MQTLIIHSSMPPPTRNPTRNWTSTAAPPPLHQTQACRRGLYAVCTSAQNTRLSRSVKCPITLFAPILILRSCMPLPASKCTRANREHTSHPRFLCPTLRPIRCRCTHSRMCSKRPTYPTITLTTCHLSFRQHIQMSPHRVQLSSRLPLAHRSRSNVSHGYLCPMHSNLFVFDAYGHRLINCRQAAPIRHSVVYTPRWTPSCGRVRAPSVEATPPAPTPNQGLARQASGTTRQATAATTQGDCENERSTPARCSVVKEMCAVRVSFRHSSPRCSLLCLCSMHSTVSVCVCIMSTKCKNPAPVQGTAYTGSAPNRPSAGSRENPGATFYRLS